MDPRNWPWRKKMATSSNSSTKTNPASKLSMSPTVTNNNNTNFPQFYSPQELQASEPAFSDQPPRFILEHIRGLGAMALKEQAEEKVKQLTDKLNAAMEDIINKEALVKQHSKVAEDAVAGWEKAEAEASSLKKELEVSNQQRAMVEGKVMNLDEALKECMKQVRQAREEQKFRIAEAVEAKSSEWNKLRSELEDAIKDLKHKLMESEAQNNAMAKSLQERAKVILESQDAKSKAETEVRLLQVKMEALEKEREGLKYEFRMVSKELEIRNKERDDSRKAAEAAHRQHLENVKKIAKLESECQRLRILVKKKLPGPAAIAQMRMEVDASMRREYHEQNKRRKSSILPVKGSGTDRDIELMETKLLAMEEEAKMLKEALAKKDVELQSTQSVSTKSISDDQSDLLHQTLGANGVAFDRFFLDSKSANGLCSSEKLDDELSCAESWASALIHELDNFKMKQASEKCLDTLSFGTTDHILDISPDSRLTDGLKKLSSDDKKVVRIIQSRDSQLQSANIMCKDAIGKLILMQKRLKDKSVSFNFEAGANSLAEVNGIMTRLDKILDSIRIAVASAGEISDEDCDGSTNPDTTRSPGFSPTSSSSQLSPTHYSLANLNFISCRLVYLVETMLTPPGRMISHCPETPDQVRCLLNAKESLLNGKGSLTEFLLRLAMVLSGALKVETSDLKSMLCKVAPMGKVEEAPMPANMQDVESVNAITTNKELESDQIRNELQKQISMTEEELKHTKQELADAKVIIGDIEMRMRASRRDQENRLLEEESKRKEVEAQLEKAEVEVTKLQKSVACLTIELADLKAEYNDSVSKCEALDRELKECRAKQVEQKEAQGNYNDNDNDRRPGARVTAPSENQKQHNQHHPQPSPSTQQQNKSALQSTTKLDQCNASTAKLDHRNSPKSYSFNSSNNHNNNSNINSNNGSSHHSDQIKYTTAEGRPIDRIKHAKISSAAAAAARAAAEEELQRLMQQGGFSDHSWNGTSGRTKVAAHSPVAGRTGGRSVDFDSEQLVISPDVRKPNGNGQTASSGNGVHRRMCSEVDYRHSGRSGIGNKIKHPNPNAASNHRHNQQVSVADHLRMQEEALSQLVYVEYGSSTAFSDASSPPLSPIRNGVGCRRTADVRGAVRTSLTGSMNRAAAAGDGSGRRDVTSSATSKFTRFFSRAKK